LLFAEQILYVRTQHPAGVERQRPDADHENRKRGKGDSGFERMPCEAPESHARIFREKCGWSSRGTRFNELQQSYSGLFAPGNLQEHRNGRTTPETGPSNLMLAASAMTVPAALLTLNLRAANGLYGSATANWPEPDPTPFSVYPQNVGRYLASGGASISW
jgi:hypothetical protein